MQLSKVSSPYGAPMGRTGKHGEPDEGSAITVERVEIDSGGYDEGGAYWGIGEPLFRALSDCGNVESFFRAASTSAALAAMASTYPGHPVTLGGLDDFTRGAIEAAFFTADPLPTSGEFYCDMSATFGKLSSADQAQLVDRCREFQAKHRRLLLIACERTGNDMATAGADYHYTSAGHGCGYWDGDWECSEGRVRDFGDLLTAAAEAMPLPEVQADLDCEHYHETGEGCGECEACEAGPAYYLA